MGSKDRLLSLLSSLMGRCKKQLGYALGCNPVFHFESSSSPFLENGEGECVKSIAPAQRMTRTSGRLFCFEKIKVRLWFSGLV